MNAEHIKEVLAGSKHALRAIRGGEHLNEEEERLRRMGASQTFLEAFRQARALVALRGAMALGFRIRKLEKMVASKPPEKVADEIIRYYGYQKSSRKGF